MTPSNPSWRQAVVGGVALVLALGVLAPLPADAQPVYELDVELPTSIVVENEWSRDWQWWHDVINAAFPPVVDDVHCFGAELNARVRDINDGPSSLTVQARLTTAAGTHYVLLEHTHRDFWSGFDHTDFTSFAVRAWDDAGVSSGRVEGDLLNCT